MHRNVTRHGRDPFRPLATATYTQVINAANHWTRLADGEEDAAASEKARGLPCGDVSAYYKRAKLYRQIAGSLEMQAKQMPMEQEAA